MRCRGYVGVACVDGTCPMANVDEYEERCIPVTKSCEECFYYKGCVDCALADTEYCIKDKTEKEVRMREARWKGAGMGDYRCSYCDKIVSGNTLPVCPNCKSIMK